MFLRVGSADMVPVLLGGEVCIPSYRVLPVSMNGSPSKIYLEVLLCSRCVSPLNTYTNLLFVALDRLLQRWSFLCQFTDPSSEYIFCKFNNKSTVIYNKSWFSVDLLDRLRS